MILKKDLNKVIQYLITKGVDINVKDIIYLNIKRFFLINLI